MSQEAPENTTLTTPVKKLLTPEEKKAALEEKIRKMEERKKKVLEREKALKKKLEDLNNPPKNRKQDAHEKILLGAAVQMMMKDEPELKKKVIAFLDKTLKRATDRRLFSLPEISGE